MKVQEVISESILSKIFGKPVAALAKGARRIGRKTPGELKFNRDLSSIKRGYNLFLQNSAEVMQMLKGIGLITPFYTYYTNMNVAQEKLSSGEWDQKRYDEENRIQIGLTAATLATGMVGNKILGSVTNVLKIVKYFPIVGPLAADIIGGLSNTAQAALIPILNTTEGRTLLAELFTVGVIEGAGDILGNVIDKLKSLVGQVDKPNLDAVKQPGQSTPIPSLKQPSTEPTEIPAQPEPVQAPKTSTGTGKYISDRFVRGPNGELRLAVDQPLQ